MATVHGPMAVVVEVGEAIEVPTERSRDRGGDPLMQELEKIHRVIANRVPGAPHESLLVLDATTGQNGISQARNFTDIVNCSGIVLAKLDGTARGGIVVPIRQQMGLPVKYVGVGEGIEDLEPFDADRFVEAMFSIDG